MANDGNAINMMANDGNAIKWMAKMADSDSDSDVDSESDKKRNFSPIFHIGGEAKKNFFIHASTRHPFLSPTCDFYMDG